MNMKETFLLTEIGRCGRNKERRALNEYRLIGELLLRFGIGPHLVGFDPLRESIRLTAEQDRGFGAAPHAEIIAVAEALCNVTNGEHAIRDAIRAGFSHPDEIHSQIFPFSEHPTNREFICTLAELVRDWIHSE